LHNTDDVDLRLDLRRACALLTERQRVVVVLVVTGMTQQEMADALGVGRPAVTRRLGRARERIGGEM